MTPDCQCWPLIFAQRHRRASEEPAADAITFTHGHFDHVGALKTLADEWDVPVYAYSLERPYLNGKASYPPAVKQAVKKVGNVRETIEKRLAAKSESSGPPPFRRAFGTGAPIEASTSPISAAAASQSRPGSGSWRAKSIALPGVRIGTVFHPAVLLALADRADFVQQGNGPSSPVSGLSVFVFSHQHRFRSYRRRIVLLATRSHGNPTLCGRVARYLRTRAARGELVEVNC